MSTFCPISVRLSLATNFIFSMMLNINRIVPMTNMVASDKNLLRHRLLNPSWIALVVRR